MLEKLKQLIRRLLRVPPDPEAPLGAPGSVRVFRAAPGYFRYRLLSRTLQQASALFGIVALFVLRPWFDGLLFTKFLIYFETLAIAGFLIQLPLSYLVIALDYENRWYMVTDRSLRIREGLFKVQERTMTFSNIQNVAIRQGPLQRFFGISDLEVRTAGGGSSSAGSDQHQGQAENLHLGYFKGVADAPEIRDAILVHLRQIRTAGLATPTRRPWHRKANRQTKVAASSSRLPARCCPKLEHCERRSRRRSTPEGRRQESS